MKAFIFAGLLLSASGPAAMAAGAFDGQWAVELLTIRGDCERSLTWEVGVRSSRISETGAFGQAVGAVDSRGQVRLQVYNASDRMSASGKLTRTSGAGAWTSPTRACSGRWRAARRS
jgi:hypothetical protein